ncbi:MAG: hypothetical protein IKC83_00080 [Clostridia bacterium]|nr:hypothetical protein [Clostridia bacterium]
MIKGIRRAIILTLILVTLLVTGGAYASWTFCEEKVDIPSTEPFSLDMYPYIEGTHDMVTGEFFVAQKFAEELTKLQNNSNSTIIDEIFETRKDDANGSWFVTVNEMAADDIGEEGAQLRELFELDKYPELTVIIKFTSGNPGYELFTTRVDVDAKDEDGNYIIPTEEFENETTYIYPVNRTTFTWSYEEGKYVANESTVGYSRGIYYWDKQENGSWGQSTTRTYDVTTWAEGTSISTAVEIEDDIVGLETTIENIDNQKEAYFKFKAQSRAVHTVNISTPGLKAVILDSNGRNVTTSRLTRGTTYYIRFTYSTEDEPQNFVFTITD